MGVPLTLYDGVAAGGVSPATSPMDALLPLLPLPPRPLVAPVPALEAFLGCLRFVDPPLGGVISGRSAVLSIFRTSEGVCFAFFDLADVGVAVRLTSKPDCMTEGDWPMPIREGSTT